MVRTTSQKINIVAKQRYQALRADSVRSRAGSVSIAR
jgi:hypothetical protein